MKPIYSVSSDGPHVQAFLALAKSESTVGNNIVAVWYIRDANTPGLWTTKSWLTSDAAEAVKCVKVCMGIPDSDDMYWELSQPLELLPGEALENPKNYEKGVLVEDPLYPLVATMPDPAPLVELLAEAVYKVANISIDQTTACEPSTQLEVIAAAFEWGIAQPDGTEVQAALAVEGTDALMAAVRACAPPPPTCTPSVGPWTTGVVKDTLVCAWVYTGSTTAPLTGGYSLTCNYEARHYFRQTRTATATRSDCSTYTCTQVNTGYAISAGSCTTTHTTGTPPPGCPAQPSCLGPASGTTSCAATAPTTWNGWGPPCTPQ